MGYSTYAKKGITWNGALRLLSRLITFIRYAVLGRLLTPANFGIFGIGAMLLSFLEIITETGINIFLVQQKDEDVSRYLNSAWLVSVFRGALLGFLLFLLAPIISMFFNAPASKQIIYFMALVPFVRGFINPSIIFFQKDLEFHKFFWFRSALLVIDTTISVIVAVFTKSAISFVWGLFVSAIFEVFFSFAFIKLWPKPCLEIEKIKTILQHGFWVTLTGIFSFFAEQGDNIAVGKLMGTASLGVYQAAYKFSILPISEITDVVGTVMFPLYTKFANDKKRLFRAFIKVTSVTSLAAIFLGIVLFLFAKEIILIIMGNQWVAAASAVRVLSLYGTLRAFFAPFAPLFLSVGKQNYVAHTTFFRVIGLLVTIIPFVARWGIVGAGYSALISILVEIPIIVYYAIKVFK